MSWENNNGWLDLEWEGQQQVPEEVTFKMKKGCFINKFICIFFFFLKILHISDITWYLSFSVWLTSHSMIISRTQVNLLTKQERFTDIENKLVVTSGEGLVGGRVDWEFGINTYTLQYLKYGYGRSNQDLLYSTSNSAQYSVIT